MRQRCTEASPKRRGEETRGERKPQQGPRGHPGHGEHCDGTIGHGDWAMAQYFSSSRKTSALVKASVSKLVDVIPPATVKPPNPQVQELSEQSGEFHARQ